MKTPLVAAVWGLSSLLFLTPALASTSGVAAIAPISNNAFFNWAEKIAPNLFPPGPPTAQLGTPGASFAYRFYPSTMAYLGVGDQDGVIYALGGFSGNQVMALGKLADWTCDVAGNCAVLAPDANGNLTALGLSGASNISLRAGNLLQFQNLTPLDSIIEVNSPTLTSEQLCSASNLPAGGAHTVPTPYPLPSSHYANNEISGPYRTYPAGIFPMSQGSGECGYIDKKSACLAPNERAVPGGIVTQADGSTDYLCNPSAYLMSTLDPDKPANNPPVANPACVKGKTMDSIWADPATQGVFIRLSWKDVNPSYGVYDWSVLDREFASALRNSKTVMLGIEVGGNSIPDWVFTTGDPGLGAAKKVVLKDWGTAADSIPNANCGFNWVVGSPADAAFKNLFNKAIADLGSHIRADQRRFSQLTGIKVTGLGQATLENRLPKRCNIAVKSSVLGDTGTQGHIIAMSTTNFNNPVFDPKYSSTADPAFGRIKDISQCVCNPQVLQFYGYTPSAVRSFYSEVEATIAHNFGYKQQVFMNISDGFPQVGESGRFLGDHLAAPITNVSWTAQGDPVYTFGAVRSSPARVPADIPAANDITEALLADARSNPAFSVENAGLDVVGFSINPNAGVRCSQQRNIDTTGSLAGSPTYPIPSGTAVDSKTARCPNLLATAEGITYDKPGGFQIVYGLETAAQIDASLWNMTLNTNALFYEHYESNAWISAKQSAANPGGVLDPHPQVQTETATANHAQATAKSAAQWNAVLLERAKRFADHTAHGSPYYANPFPTQYTVALSSAPGSQRYFFNSRACLAFAKSGTPVRINSLTILD